LDDRDRIPLDRFGLNEEQVYFNRAILILLNKPKYVQFLDEKKRKPLLVTGNNEICRINWPFLKKSIITAREIFEYAKNT